MAERTHGKNGMRDLLLITFHFPPSDAIGAMRARGLAKYLGEFGWNVTVLTPEHPLRLDAPHVVETGYRDVIGEWKRRIGLRPEGGLQAQLGTRRESTVAAPDKLTRMLQAAKSLLTFPDEKRGWISPARLRLSELRRTHTFDAVLSTAHPISAHAIGAVAKREFQCSWIADFRDLWVQNSNNPNPAFLRPLERWIERRILQHADSLVTVSEPLAATLRHGYPRKRVDTILNGFDPEDFALPQPQPESEFTIVYAGQLYEGKRDPSPLLRAIAELKRRSLLQLGEIRLRFYGPPETWVVHTASRLGIGEIVSFEGVVPRRVAIARQRRAHVLLSVGWNGADSAGVYTGKIFEYLASGRPILHIGGDPGVLTELLRKTQAGVHPGSDEELSGWLLERIREWRTTGGVTYAGKAEEISAYSQYRMAEEFSVLLNQLACRTQADVAPASMAKAG